jgi:hypothetical protein
MRPSTSSDEAKWEKKKVRGWEGGEECGRRTRRRPTKLDYAAASMWPSTSSDEAKW